MITIVISCQSLFISAAAAAASCGHQSCRRQVGCWYSKRNTIHRKEMIETSTNLSLSCERAASTTSRQFSSQASSFHLSSCCESKACYKLCSSLSTRFSNNMVQPLEVSNWRHDPYYTLRSEARLNSQSDCMSCVTLSVCLAQPKRACTFS